MSHWIQTFSGKRFAPARPLPELFDIRDIAHSLSLLCRFNGHCRVFYSVAEHSVRVSRLLPDRLARWGLLHDLGEAYLGDLPRPIKAQFPLFVEIEENLLTIAASVFGLPWPMPPEVKAADDVLLATEFRDLMAPMDDPWPLSRPPLDEPIRVMTSLEAEQAFLARYHALGDTGVTREDRP